MINHQNNPNRRDRIISLLYNSNKSLSSSVKNNNAKHTHIPKIKNHNKSYFILSINALIQTCCNHTARSTKNIPVITKTNKNWIINFDWIFFNNNFREILSVFSLFFSAFIRHFKFIETYRIIDTKKINNINSFHIQKIVQNFPSRPSLNVTKVWRKNCNNSQITNILHNKTNRCLSDFERIDNRRDENFFITVKKRPKRILIYFILIFCFLSSLCIVLYYINCQNITIIAVVVSIVWINHIYITIVYSFTHLYSK